MTVAEVGERVSGRELIEWIAYYELEPWGGQEEQHRWGMLLSMFANANRDPEQCPDALDPRDFFPNLEYAEGDKEALDEERSLTPMERAARIPEEKRKEQQGAFGQALVEMLGGKLVTEDGKQCPSPTGS